MAADPFGRAILRVGRSQGVAGVLRLALPIVLARLLSPDDFGLFSILTAVALLIFNLGNLGLPTAITYQVASSPRRAETVAFNSLLLALAVGALATLLGAAVVLAIGERLVGGAAGASPAWALAAVPAHFVFHAVLGISLGRDELWRYNGLSIGFHLTVFVGAIAGYAFGGSGASALVGWSSGSLLGALAAVVLAWPIWRRHARLDLGLWREATLFGAKTHASGVLTFLNYRLDVLFVGALLGAAEAGLYAAAVALGETLWFFSQVSGSVLFARVAAAGAADGTAQGTAQGQLTALTVRLVFLSSGAVAVVLALLAAPVLTAVYADAYGAAAPALRIVLVGIVALSASRVLAQYVAGVGRPELNIPGSLLGLVANVALNLALIPPLGIAGAALASAVSYSLTLAHRLWCFGRLQPAARPVVDCLVPRLGDLRAVWGSLRR